MESSKPAKKHLASQLAALLLFAVPAMADGEKCPMKPAAAGAPAPYAEETLAAPPLAAGKAYYLAVEVGTLPPHGSLTVCDAAGRLIGTVAPFGSAARRSGGTYLLALPAESVTGGRLALRLALTAPDQPARPPTAGELRSLELRALAVSGDAGG